MLYRDYKDEYAVKVANTNFYFLAFILGLLVQVITLFPFINMKW